LAVPGDWGDYMNIKDTAIRYRKEYDLSIFPVNLFWDSEEEKTKKKPLVSWKNYQKKKPNLDQVKTWWDKWPQAGVGIVTGELNDLLVLDIDEDEGEEYVYDKGIGAEPSPTVRTGGGGLHIYFRFPEKEIKIGARISKDGLGLDYRGEGGFVVAPPSPYPLEDGETSYNWELNLKEYDPKDPPPWLLEEIEKRESGDNANVDELLEGVQQGQRNDSAASVAGRLLTKFDEEDWNLAWETLKAWNQRNKPPLPEDELRKTFESIAKKEKSKEEPFKYRQESEGEKDNWEIVNKIYKDNEKKEARYQAAQLLLEERHFVALSEGDQLLIYNPDEGTFNDYGREYIKTRLQAKLTSALTTHDVNEIINHVERSSLEKERRFGPDDPYLLCVNNGVLDLEDGELMDHSPSYQFRRSLPVTYKPGVTSEKLTEFFQTTFKTDQDIELIEEIAGYTLYRDYPIQKSFMFIGGGSNGKGVTLDLISRMLGDENVTSKNLQQLTGDNRFAVNSLYKKHANIAGDLPGSKLGDTGIFKMLTGQDLIEAEVKYAKRGIKFRNYAKMIFSANKVPPSPDDTDAFHRRWILITFPFKFVSNPTAPNEKPRDPQLREKLDTEKVRTAFFNRALRGLQRLLDRGKFTYDPSTSEARRKWERQARPVKAFVQDKLETGGDKQAWKREVYQAYKEYCKENEVPEHEIKKQSQFTKELKKYVDLESIRPVNQETGKQQPAYKGLELVEVPF